MNQNKETVSEDPFAVEVLSKCVQAGMAFLIAFSVLQQMRSEDETNNIPPITQPTVTSHDASNK